MDEIFMDVVFLMRIEFYLVQILDYWGEKIEQMFCNQNVIQLNSGSLFRAATKGTCSGL